MVSGCFWNGLMVFDRNNYGYAFEAWMACPQPKSGQVHPFPGDSRSDMFSSLLLNCI